MSERHKKRGPRGGGRRQGRGGRNQSGGGRGGRNQGGTQGRGGRKCELESVDVGKLPKVNITEKTRLIVENQKLGTTGDPIKLLTNYFPLNLPPCTFYQYSVTFNPEIERTVFARAMLGLQDDTLLKKNGNLYIFDGRAVLYTQKPLRKDSKKKIELVSISKEKKKYQITIKFACSLSGKSISQEILQLFNIMYRRALSHLGLQQIGRNHYKMKDAKAVPQHNVNILPGFLETIYMTDSGVLFNVDVIYKTLRTDTVLHMLRDKRKERNGEENFSEEMENTIVMCSYNNRTVHIDSVDWTKNPRSKFRKSNGKQISFAKYFKEQYRVTIRDLNQPLLLHKSRRNGGKIEYYVPELCSMTGLTKTMREDRYCMQDIKKTMGLNPINRAEKIVKFVRESTKNKEFAKILSEWSFKLDPRLIRVKGRKLPAEIIKFGKGRNLEADSRAQWDIRSTPLFRGVEIKNWCVIYSPRSKRDVDGFISSLFRVSTPLGIRFAKPKSYQARGDHAKDFQNCLEQNVRKKCDFVLVILPEDRKARYDVVKKYLCLKVPIPSQCVRHRTITGGGLLSKATKIAVQIASKLGGCPWTLNWKFPKTGVMICGMDVYHSGEIVNKTKASIVGFTATMDGTMSSYFSRILINKPGQELVKTLQPALEEALNEYKKRNRRYPGYVIFYRDGVGEGQVKDVKKNEVVAVLRSFHNLKIKVKMCYLVVLKRIHSRLFYENRGGLQNPPPGTIVDTGITHKNALEFFLVSQNVNQGTATPTRYQCIYNDAKCGPDYLQRLTYKLCHMYFNWFGTVRVPSVCMYAHKVAFLVGQSVGREDPKRRLNHNLYYL